MRGSVLRGVLDRAHRTARRTLAGAGVRGRYDPGDDDAEHDRERGGPGHREPPLAPQAWCSHNASCSTSGNANVWQYRRSAMGLKTYAGGGPL
ncbi:hypothetical protein GCM10020218_024950 [Dactylosporangium vinaceum]